MKRLLLLIALLSSIVINAQKPKKGVFYTDIKNPRNVYVKNNNGEIRIQKADSVFIGKVVVNQTIKSNVYLLSFKESVDSLGNYWTFLEFGNPESPISTFFDLAIVIRYKSPCETTNWQAFGQRIGSGYECNEEKTECFFYARQYIPQLKTFSVMIKSKERLYPVISGIDGAYN